MGGIGQTHVILVEEIARLLKTQNVRFRHAKAHIFIAVSVFLLRVFFARDLPARRRRRWGGFSLTAAVALRCLAVRAVDQPIGAKRPVRVLREAHAHEKFPVLLRTPAIAIKRLPGWGYHLPQVIAPPQTGQTLSSRAIAASA